MDARGSSTLERRPVWGTSTLALRPQRPTDSTETELQAPNPLLIKGRVSLAWEMIRVGQPVRNTLKVRARADDEPYIYKIRLK